MELTELESFVAVCRTGSFTEAARRCGLTQPGVSRHVQRLEQELGMQLLERDHRSVIVTDAGQRLLAYAEDALERHRAFLQSLERMTDVLQGELRIAASSTPGECVLPPLLSAFTQRHPNVRPRLFVGDSASVVEEVAGKEWDLGFVGIRARGGNLLYDVIGHDQVVLAVPKSHPFASRTAVPAAELEGQPMLEREGGSGTLRAFKAALARAGVAVPHWRTVMVLNSAHAILSAVHNGLGLGIVSSLEFEQHGFQGVRRVSVADVPLSRELYMVRVRNRPLSPVAAAFVRWVLDRAGDAGASDANAPYAARRTPGGPRSRPLRAAQA